MPSRNLPRHHIHKLTRLAAVLDAQGRYAEADRLDHIVLQTRTAQWWNPIRTLKNWQNANEVNSNQDNPAAIMRLMMLNMTKLYNDAQKQGFLVGLPENLRPTVLRMIGECYHMLSSYADQYGQTEHLQPTSSRYPTPIRTADLASGIDRDITDVVNLLSNLTSTDYQGHPLFPGGDKLFTAIQMRLKTIGNVLEGTTSAQQAEQQIPPPQNAPTGPTGEGQAVLPSPLPAVTPASYQTNTPPVPSAYSQTGEQYMDQTYQRELRQPGSPEYTNEMNDYLAWGLRNGGLSALMDKMRQDRHTPQFQQAVQRAWQAKGLSSAPIQTKGTVGPMSASAVTSPFPTN